MLRDQAVDDGCDRTDFQPGGLIDGAVGLDGLRMGTVQE